MNAVEARRESHPQYDLQTPEIVSYQTTCIEVFKNLYMPIPVEFIHTPLHVFARRDEDSTEYVAIIDSSFSNRRFYNFLKSVTNDIFDPSIEAVLGDWVLPDFAKKYPTSDLYVNLQTMHEALGEHWEIFEYRRHKYMTAIEKKRAIPAFFPSEYLTQEQLPGEFVKLVLNGNKNIRDTFFAYLKNFSIEELRSFITNSRSNGKLKKTETSMDHEALCSRLLLRIRNSLEFQKDFFRSELWFGISDVYTLENFVSYELERTDDKPVTIYRKKNGRESDPLELQKTIQRFDSDYYLTYENGRAIYKRGYSVNLDGVLPVIHWTTKTVAGSDGHTENFRTIHVTDIFFQTLLAEIDDTSLQIRKGADTLLGLLAVAYFSPQIRKHWPERMGLPKSKRDQEMGPAQAPVLAHILKKQLESSPFLVAMEKAVQRLATL